MERLQQQIEFLVELDKIKKIVRQTYLADGSRKENDAEHSWHLAIMAAVLAEYFPKNIDILKVIKMVLIHDVVEIDAGDTFCYDARANEDKEEREQKAADRIYHLLPEEQEKEYRELWEEFEAGSSQEAVFAAILDRLQPVLLNVAGEGKSWKEHDIVVGQVLQRTEKVLQGPPEIAAYLKGILQEAVEKGYLRKD